jgi:hypothetical protein
MMKGVLIGRSDGKSLDRKERRVGLWRRGNV